MWAFLWNNRIQCIAVVLFSIGFVTLLLNRNLIKKILGLNIMDTASCLLLTSMGYISDRTAPIVTEAAGTAAEAFVNPLPAGLVLTGIVVSVSVTALMLALTITLYRQYHTLDLDEIYMMAKETEEEPASSAEEEES